MYHTEPPTDKTIREWYMKFQQSGCLCTAKRSGRPGPSAETEPPEVNNSRKRAAVRLDKNLERYSIHRYASFCHVCLGCCTVNFQNPGGTYE